MRIMAKNDYQSLPETYEINDLKTPLERFEWDNIWWEQTEKTNALRVLYIGDSISCALRQKATAISGETVLFDNFASSKALDNQFLWQGVKAVLAQQNKQDAVLVNFGLHGWHLEDTTTYAELYRRFLEKLKAEVQCPVFLVLTTRLADAERNKRVVERNKRVLQIAEESGLAVIDLFTVSEEIKEHQMPDGVHFDNVGYQYLAQYLVEQFKSNFDKYI